MRSLIGALAAAYPFRRTAGAAEVQLKSKQALSGALEGMEATVVEVTFAPGAVPTEHRHPGFIAGYVLEGEFRFGVEGQKEQILGPGETFFEAAGALHTIGASALPDKPAKILSSSWLPWVARRLSPSDSECPKLGLGSFGNTRERTAEPPRSGEERREEEGEGGVLKG